MQIGLRLRERRISLGLSQDAVTRGLLDRSYLSRIEHGRVVPSLDILTALATRLGMPLESLLSSAEHARARELHDLVRLADIAGTEHAFRQAWTSARECQELPSMVAVATAWFKRRSRPTPSQECVAALACTFDGVALAAHGLTQDMIAIGLCLAASLYMHDKFSESAKVYEELLRHSPLPADLARILIGAGSAKFRLFDYEAAITCYEQALDVVQATEDIGLIARAHHGAGICLHALLRHDDAYRHTLLANSLYPKQTDKWYETLHNLGVMELDNNQVEDAVNKFDLCWKFYLRNGCSRSAGLLAEEFARVEAIKGDIDAAQRWVRDGLRHTVGEHPHISGRLWVVSEILHMRAHRIQQADDARLAGQSCLGNHYEIVRRELCRQFRALPDEKGIEPPPSVHQTRHMDS